MQSYCENAEDIASYGELSLFASPIDQHNKNFNQTTITDKLSLIKESIKVENIKQLSKKFIAKLEGIDTPEQAAGWCNFFVGLSREKLPTPDQGNYYWHDLIGARVISLYMGREIMLGTITSMQRCSANDNMVVLGETGKYRYIPFICPTYVTEVQLESQNIGLDSTVKVNWDPDF